MRLHHKVAIVSGAAHGIGEAVARLFGAEGAKVTLADVLVEDGEAVAADMRASGTDARFVATDVTQEAHWRRVIDLTVTAHGRLDILINNAGVSGTSSRDYDSVEDWQLIMDVNAKSAFLGTKLAVAEMAKTGGGAIVNISSIMGMVGSAGSHPAYHASKAAVRNYTKAAACRYGAFGIRVNSVHPGYLPPMLSSDIHSGVRPLSALGTQIEKLPLNRMGQPIEVARGVLYLASDDASYVTGAELAIDGGFLAQ
jgi:NAD(P)-dependent dehydrogenase (short-subunit alcohol dehydrogenase family)